MVVFYMHFCSAFCATGFVANCNKEERSKEKSCCAPNEKTPSKDCQDLHLSFFKTTGQFSSDANQYEVKFCPIPFEASSLLDIFFVQLDDNRQRFNLFHPPPVPADIRILIRSFQI